MGGGSDATVISGWLEREAKYSGKWASRFVSFNPQTRKISYGETDQKIKAVMNVTKIVRRAEQREMKATDKNLLTMEISGTPDNQAGGAAPAAADATTPAWVLRFPDHSTFQLWYRTIRGALAAIGQMESYDFGLPELDPRSNMRFADLPIESLFRFSLLEKAIFFYFGLCTVVTPEEGPNAIAAAVAAASTTGGGSGGAAGAGGGSASTSGSGSGGGQGAAASAAGVPSSSASGSGSSAAPLTGAHYLMIGDKYVYIFRTNADVLRCFSITGIRTVFLGDNFFALKFADSEQQHDVFVKSTAAQGREVASMLRQLQLAIRGDAGSGGGGGLPIEVWGGAVDQLVKERLNLAAPEGFKISIVSPTPKSRLKQALDAYERNNGSISSASSPNPNAPAGGGNHGSGGGHGGGAGSGGSGGIGGRRDSFSNISIDDGLSQLLIKLGLPQYVRGLKRQHIDLDVITCMEASDLANFGVNDPRHREMIVSAAVHGADAVLAANGGSSSAPTSPPGSFAGSPSLGAGATGALESVESFDIPPAGAAAAAPNKKVVIDLDDDDDLPPPPKKNIVIVLDSDDDDDLGLLPTVKPQAATAAAASSPPPSDVKRVVLSSDDDI